MTKNKHLAITLKIKRKRKTSEKFTDKSLLKFDRSTMIYMQA